MSYYGTMQVVDGSGWSKTFSLEKALTLIGSAAFNDVVLSEEHGGGVAAVHLQLIRTQTGTHGFRLVNLVGEPLTMILSGARGRDVVPPSGSKDLGDGDAVQVGDFTMTFYLRAANGVALKKRSENIGIRLEMPGVALRSGGRLAGLLTVVNFGEEKRCQFEIELEGLPSDCFQIDPAPLLYPGGEEKLQVRFYHRGVRPLAGERPIRLRASAVGAYPTEEVILPLVLDVEPVYRHEINLAEDPQALKGEREPNVAAAGPAPAPIVQPARPAAKPARPAEEPLEQPGEAPSPPVERPDDDPPAEPERAGSPQPEKPEAVPPEPHAAGPAPDGEEPEADWWAEGAGELPAVAHSDPLADLKRGITPRLSVEKANIQVLKAAPEDLEEKKDES